VFGSGFAVGRFSTLVDPHLDCQNMIALSNWRDRTETTWRASCLAALCKTQPIATPRGTEHRSQFHCEPGGVSAETRIDQPLSWGAFFSWFFRAMSFCFSKWASTSSSEAQPWK
jgi:hypothetical protein